MRKFIDKIKKELFGFSEDDNKWLNDIFLVRAILTWFGIIVIAALATIAIPFGILLGLIEPFINIAHKIAGRGNRKRLLADLQKHQEWCDKEGVLKFDRVVQYPNDFRYFIKFWFFAFNDDCTTITIEGVEQCPSGKRRSLGDIYRICKFYFPECTMRQVLLYLVEALAENKIHACYCNTIHKFVFHTVTNNNEI